MKHKNLIKLILASMAIGALVGCKGGSNNQASSEQKSSQQQSSETTSSGSEQQSSEEQSSEEQSSQEDQMPDEYDLLKYWAGNPSEEFYDVLEKENSTEISYTELTGEESGGWAYVSRPFAYDAAKVSKFNVYKKFSFTAKLEKTSGSNIVMIKAEGSSNFEKRIEMTEEEKTFEFSTAFISDWSGMQALLFFANRNIKEAGNGKITLTSFCLSKEEVDPAYDISGSMPTVPQDWNYYDGEEKLNVMYSWGYNQQGEIATEKVGDNYKFTWGGDVAKTEPWAFVSAKIKNASEEHLMKDSGFKKLVFTVTGTAGQEAIFKFEAHQGNTNLNANEAKVALTGEEQTIEVDIKAPVAVADADQYWVLIMPAPNQTGNVAAGEITLTGCYLDQNAIVIPEETNDPLYPVIWMDKVASHDPCYTIYNDTHLITVDYAKEAAGWESLLLKVSESDEWFVKDENANAYNRVACTLKATEHVKVLLKPYDTNANEHWFELQAGVAQEVDFTVDAATADLTKPFAVFICAGDGEQTTSGRVFIDGLRLSRENVNIGYDGPVKLNRVYSANAEYQTELSADNDLVANFAFTQADYHMIEMFMSARDNALYNKLTGTIVSTVDTHVLFKPADNAGNELSVALEAGVEYELDHLFNNKIDYNWSKVIVFVGYDAGDTLTGKITFKDFQVEIYNPEYVSKDPNPINMAGGYIDNWFFASDCYALKRIENGTKVVFGNRGAGWENMQANFVLTEGWFNQADYTRFTGTFTSTVDITILLKPYDNNAFEHAFNLTANEPTDIDFTIDTASADFTKAFVLFVGTTGCAAGELDIENLALTNAKTNVEKDGKIFIDRAYFAHEDKYNIEGNLDGKGMSLQYTKVEGMEWEGIQLFTLAHDFSDNKTLHLKGQVDGDVHLKFKIDGPAEEQEVVLDMGDFDTQITFTNAIDAKWNKVIVFVAYEAGDKASATIKLSEFYFG